MILSAKWAIGSGPSRKHLLQVEPAEQFQDQERRRSLRVQFVDPNQVGMIQVLGDFDFVLQIAQFLAVPGFLQS